MVADGGVMGVMGVMDQFGELFFGPKTPQTTDPYDGTTNTTPETTFDADHYYYSSSIPWRATSSSYIPKQTLDHHQRARTKKLANYKLDRQRRKTARQQEQQMMFHPLQEDLISDTTPCAYNHHRIGGDNDRNDDNDDNDNDFVYVRLRKSDLLLANPVPPPVSLSHRIDRVYDQLSDRNELHSLAKPPRRGAVHRDGMQRFLRLSSFAGRHHHDPTVDLAPVLHDLGCGLGPLPPWPSSSARKNHPIKNAVSKVPSPADTGGDRDLTAVLDRVEQMRNRRRQHDKEKTPAKSSRKQQMAKKSTRTSTKSSSLPSRQSLLWDRLDTLEKEIRGYKTLRAQSFKRRFDELAGELQEEEEDQQQYDKSHSHPSDHSVNQRLQRLEREIMMAKRYPASQRQVVVAERFSPSKSYASHYPPSQSSRVSKRSRVGASWLDDLQSDFVRRMHLDEYNREAYHPEDSFCSDSPEDSPTTQLKDSLAKAHETFHDKSALHRETFQSIGKVRRSIHRNSAYKEEMLERERRGEGGEIRDIVEGRRETVGNPYASIGANARPVYSVQKIVPQMAPPDARRYSEVSIRHPEETRAKTKMSTTTGRVIIPEFLDPRKTPRRIHIPDRYSVLGTPNDDDDDE